MRQLSLTQARAKLSTLLADIGKGKGPVPIAQTSKIKAALVDAEWHSRVEEELARISHDGVKLMGCGRKYDHNGDKPGPSSIATATEQAI
jgi:PHD/YefM family antitoxin component YafN of YafNO toxin-antitoxin module